MRSLIKTISAAALLIVSACGGDKATGPAPVAAISISPTSLTLKVGETQSLSSTMLDAKGAPLTGRAVSWSIADASIAQVSAAGLVTAMAPGQTTVTASAEGKSSTSTVAIYSAPQIALSTSKTTAFAYADSVIITWTAAYATECRADGAWKGARAAAGTEKLAVDTTGALSYTLTCLGAYGTSTSKTITVNATRVAASSCSAQRIEETGLPNAPVQMGQYVVTNSIGVDVFQRVSGLSSCISSELTSRDKVSFSVSWNIPLPPQSVPETVGFPNVSVGRLEPVTLGSSRTTSARMPIQAKNVPASMEISYDAEYNKSGQFVLLGDAFFYGSATSDWRQMKELMLIMDVSNEPIQFFADSQSVSLGDLDWIRANRGGIRRPHPGYPTDSSTFLAGIQYHRKNPTKSARFRLKPIIDDMIEIGFLKPDDWMVFFQFGVEPATGSGALQVRQYQLRW